MSLFDERAHPNDVFMFFPSLNSHNTSIHPCTPRVALNNVVISLGQNGILIGRQPTVSELLFGNVTESTFSDTIMSWYFWGGGDEDYLGFFMLGSDR